MLDPHAATLIKKMEDFYEVWSNGFTGDRSTVAGKLADYNISSLQTAKRIMRTATLLCEPTSKADAIREADEFEECGLKCRIEHVGKKRLDSIKPTTIVDTLTENGRWPLDSVYTDRDARTILHVTVAGSRQHVHCDTESEQGFCLYLACLRDLVRRGMILQYNSRNIDG